MRIDLPRITGGTDREKIAQIKSYLYQLVPQLQFIFGDLEKTFSARIEALESTNTATARKSTAEVHISKPLVGYKWYKVGTISGDACALVAMTIGGQYNGTTTISPTVVRIATEHGTARIILDTPPSNSADNCVTAVGLVADGDNKYGLYIKYSASVETRIDVSIHTHMGLFEPAWLAEAPNASMNYYLQIAEE
jgi:hypothetical protein